MMPSPTLRDLLGELDHAVGYTEDLQVGFTPERPVGTTDPVSPAGGPGC